MLSRLVYRGLSALGLPALARGLCNGAVVLCYHNVVDMEESAGEPSLHLPLSAFRRQMQWLVRHYEIVPLGDLVGRLAQRRSLRRLAAVTFDDGYVGFFENALPVLRDLKIPATVFVVADAPTNREPFWWDHPAVQAVATSQRRSSWLTELRGDGAAILQSLPRPALSTLLPRAQQPADWKTITGALSGDLALGVHSRMHRALDTLSDTELEDELVTSREMIAGETGTAPELFAYPYGVWNARVREAVRSAGYSAAVTLDFGLIRNGHDPLALRRVNVPAGISDAALAAWLAGLKPRLPAGSRSNPVFQSREIAPPQASVRWKRA